MDDKMDPKGLRTDITSEFGGRADHEQVKVENWYRKKRVMLPIIFLFILGLVAFYYYYTNVRGYASTDDAFIDSDNVTISSKILGRISYLGVDDGDTVAEGDTLVRLDSSDLKAQAAQAQASIESARQNAKLAEVTLARAQDDFNRADIQLKGKAITQEQFDHARSAFRAAQAQFDVAGAAVNSAQAQLDVIQTQILNTEILAPFKGVVARKWVMPGDVIQAAQPIFTIFKVDDVWVTAMFEETKISSIRQGDQVRISVDAYPDHKFEGKVIFTGAAAASQFSLIPPNNASGNFTKVTQRIPVKISIIQTDKNPSAPPLPLRAGMSVEVKLKTGGN
jgi:membrane fusion protein (multidrug efflux system)